MGHRHLVFLMQCTHPRTGLQMRAHGFVGSPGWAECSQQGWPPTSRPRECVGGSEHRPMLANDSTRTLTRVHAHTRGVEATLQPYRLHGRARHGKQHFVFGSTITSTSECMSMNDVHHTPTDRGCPQCSPLSGSAWAVPRTASHC